MLDGSVITDGLEAETLDYRCVCLDETTSTNDEIKNLIKQNVDEGIVVTSLIQSGGYGRQGRTWTSPAGGLYLSMLLRPADHGISPAVLPTLSLVAALAVLDMLRLFTDDQTLAVKWPNDVLCSQGKLCGISLEAISGAVCIGIGTNVFAPTAQQIEDHIRNRGISSSESASTSSLTQSAIGAFLPAYLNELNGRHVSTSADRDRVLERVARALLGTFDSAYGTWLEDGFAPFVDKYNKHAFLNGRTVGIASMNADVIAGGLVVRTDEHGNLVLSDEKGQEHQVASGEAHILL
ncbi:MAG: biotin--[acetyl-CoA-carboxylase] ligase [Raoultibacter sp.]